MTGRSVGTEPTKISRYVLNLFGGDLGFDPEGFLIGASRRNWRARIDGFKLSHVQAPSERQNERRVSISNVDNSSARTLRGDTNDTRGKLVR
jgi:hypothetical protein